MSIISIRNVTKKFVGITAVDDASIEIAANEFFAVLGPSGCGKTTLLRMLAGFEAPTTGEILIDGVDVSTMAPNKRPVNMVFQSYAVFPHMTVLANVGYGLRVTGVPSAETRQRAEEALEMVQLAHLGDRKPDQLSGGQRQRVALARALVKRPKVLLLDEPMSALDAKLREQMQLELARLQEEVGITFVIVTHDQDEALSMADRIAVMQSGRVEQIATPEVLYESPNSRFVADFIGKVNLLDGRVTGASDQGVKVDVAHLGKVTVPHSEHAQGPVSLAVRPEKIRMTAGKPDASLLVRGRIVDWVYYGDTSHIRVQTASGPPMSVTIQNDTRSTIENGDVGDQVWLSWREEDTLILDR
ncbi:MAG: ABC transporter ATP-binding protein [Boseongicola sp. SB0670_bin_30]|nr:ABC transporter ATP-binding protein [Boseongicola sp. SB0670_bin_30]